ncbi:MAG: hypothetical protein JJ900_14975 [Rhodospirillales bacterium]|nr:hypothetical protein [Rhodospirillales bacterium]MBO6788149.1 hypothetical protein [Rhodospirillales bacterium]
MPTIRFKKLSLPDHNFQDLDATYCYWSEKKNTSGGAAPSWSDINMLDLPPGLLPQICVVDVVGDPHDFTYRYWGTAVTGLHHYDLSNKSVRMLTPPDYAQCIWDQYTEVLTTGEPHTYLTEVPLDSGFYAFYVALRLPLSSDGVKIDKIMAAEEYGQDRDQLKNLFNRLP